MGKKFKFEESIRVRVKTSDDWHPNHKGDLVEVSYLGKLPDGNSRVCVWGADDLGMEYDVKDKGLARKMFRKLKDKDNITKAELISLGFVYA